MDRFEITIAAVALAIVLGAVGYYIWNNYGGDIPFFGADPLEKEVVEIKTQAGSNQVSEEQSEDLEEIAQSFADAYVAALGDGDAEAAKEAKRYVTRRGKTVLEKDDTALKGLERFTYKPDPPYYLAPPERIDVVNTVKKTEEFAEAETQWHYADRTETYYFYFKVEDNKWRLDSIQSVQQ